MLKKEEGHVSFKRIIAMEPDGVKPFAASEPPASPGSRLVELWDDPARSCGITTITVLLAPVVGQSESALRQRLREWYYAAADKRGDKRREVDVSACFAPLLRWILAWWKSDERRVVLVLADRGLYARWLYEAIQRCGWHPFLRVNAGGTYRTSLGGPVRPLSSAWVEQGFKDYKRGGWQWHQTKMTDPERANRLWLAMAVATLWVVSAFTGRVFGRAFAYGQDGPEMIHAACLATVQEGTVPAVMLAPAAGSLQSASFRVGNN